MKMVNTGSGWRYETMRHSNARRFGKAGGTYHTDMKHVTDYGNTSTPVKEHKEQITINKTPVHNSYTKVMIDESNDAVQYKRMAKEASEPKTKVILNRLSKEEASHHETLMKVDSDGDNIPNWKDKTPFIKNNIKPAGVDRYIIYYSPRKSSERETDKYELDAYSRRQAIGFFMKQHGDDFKIDRVRSI